MATDHPGLEIMTGDVEMPSGSVEKGINDTEPQNATSIHDNLNERHALQDILGQRISNKYTDYLLLACCFLSGLSDTGCFNTWSCFVNMQTGNTIFLALGVSHQPTNKPYGWLHSLIAIVTFLVGCACFGLAQRLFGRVRGLMMGSFALQAICLAIAAGIVQSNFIPHDSTTSESTQEALQILVPIVFVAFQAGGQVVLSQFLGYPEIPTTVLTNVYSGLVTEKFGWRHMADRCSTGTAKWVRRLAAVIRLGVGAIVGGFLTKSDKKGLAVIFWIGTGLKLGIAVGLFWWEQERHQEKKDNSM